MDKEPKDYPDYHEWQLLLPEMWFTGKEWSDGTAEATYRKMYRERAKQLQAEEKARESRDDLENPEVGKRYTE